MNSLKILGSFVRDVLSNPVARKIVEAINAVAWRMSIYRFFLFPQNLGINALINHRKAQLPLWRAPL